MKKFLIVLLLFAGCWQSSVCAQSIWLQYEFIDKAPYTPVMASRSIYELNATAEASLYIKMSDKLIYMDNQERVIKKSGKNKVIVENISDNVTIFNPEKIVYFKNMAENSIEYNTTALNKELFVRDELGTMEWELSESDTVYMGFSCKIATTTHRGRYWTVFFSDSLGINVAPWKFSGLPGVVLHAFSDGRIYEFNALEVKTSKENYEIKNPFSEKERDKMLSWDGYTEAYHKLLKNLVNKLNADNKEGGNTGALVRVPEEIIEHLGFSEVR